MDLPATGGITIKHKDLVENIKVNAILHYMKIYYEEIRRSQSAACFYEFASFDTSRWRRYFQHLIRLIDDKACNTDYDRLDRLMCENKYLRKRLRRYENE